MNHLFRRMIFDPGYHRLPSARITGKQVSIPTLQTFAGFVVLLSGFLGIEDPWLYTYVTASFNRFGRDTVRLKIEIPDTQEMNSRRHEDQRRHDCASHCCWSLTPQSVCHDQVCLR